MVCKRKNTILMSLNRIDQFLEDICIEGIVVPTRTWDDVHNNVDALTDMLLADTTKANSFMNEFKEFIKSLYQEKYQKEMKTVERMFRMHPDVVIERFMLDYEDAWHASHPTDEK